MMQNLDGLSLARVIAIHAHDNSCDCQLLYDGSRLTGVPMMTSMMTTSSGRVDWHEPEGNAWDKEESKTRDIIAILGSASGNPLVLGFLAKPVSQMLFERKNFRVDRHASDVYSTIDGDGNIELAHPSGTYCRIGTSASQENLTGKDYDKLWAITRNKTKRVWLAASVAKNGKATARITIDPDGYIDVSNLAANGSVLASVQMDTFGKIDVRNPKAYIVINKDGAITISNTEAKSSINFGIDGSIAFLTGQGKKLTHNGVNIGADHVHGGVTAGGVKTKGPEDPPKTT